MKRTLGLALALVMLGLSIAKAEVPDFSAMSDNELIASYYLFMSEMEKRGIEVPGIEKAPKAQQSNTEELGTSTFQEGTYIIGQTIPAGMYIVTCKSTETDDLSNMIDSYSSMFGSLGDDSQYGSMLDSYGDMLGSLDEGMHISVLSDYGAVIEEYYMKIGDSRAMIFSEGTALKIEDGSCTIEKVGK